MTDESDARYQQALDAYIAATFETTVDPGTGRIEFYPETGAWSSWTGGDPSEVHFTWKTNGEHRGRSDIGDSIDLGAIIRGIVAHAPGPEETK